MSEKMCLYVWSILVLYGVVCPALCEEDDVRIRKDSSGKLQYLSGNTWGMVCGDDWTLELANVACRTLGYGRALEALTFPAAVSESTVPNSDDITLTVIRCDDDDVSLRHCTYQAGEDVTCTGSRYAGVRCANIRLAGGPSESDGRLEVYHPHDHIWGSYCDHHMTWDVATVVCRTLGWGVSEYHQQKYSAHEGHVVMHEAHCEGDEERLEDCEGIVWEAAGCTVQHNAAVTCSTECAPGEFHCGFGAHDQCIPAQQLCDFEPQCFDESDEKYCYPCKDYEFLCEAEWSCIGNYKVCDGVGDCQDNSDEDSCGSVCPFGESRCLSGACIRTSWFCDGAGDCDDGSDESYCNQVRLVGGPTPHEGRVEVKVGAGGMWGTICGVRFGPQEADVVCRAYGMVHKEILPTDVYGEGSGVVWYENVTCNGAEPHLVYCGHDVATEETCGHQHDVGVTCVPAADVHTQLTGDSSSSSTVSSTIVAVLVGLCVALLATIIALIAYCLWTRSLLKQRRNFLHPTSNQQSPTADTAHTTQPHAAVHEASAETHHHTRKPVSPKPRLPAPTTSALGPSVPDSSARVPIKPSRDNDSTSHYTPHRPYANSDSGYYQQINDGYLHPVDNASHIA